MSKFLFFTTACIIFCHLSIRGQNVTVVYEKNEKFPSEILEAVPDLADFKNPTRYSLKVRGNTSVLCLDSTILRAAMLGDNRKRLCMTQCIYKDYAEDRWLRAWACYKDGMAYEQRLSELSKWKTQLTRSGIEKDILGYTCEEVRYKGKTAFYTTEIPISDGPGTTAYLGLPGLILEYEDEVGLWTAVHIDLDASDTISIPEVKTTDRESKIQMSMYELDDLPKDQVIRLDRNSPVNTWLKFGDGE